VYAGAWGVLKGETGGLGWRRQSQVTSDKWQVASSSGSVDSAGCLIIFCRDWDFILCFSQ